MTIESAEHRFARLPGWELVSAGLQDQAAGRQTIPALLVDSASDRLTRLGLPVAGSSAEDTTERLYRLVESEVGEAQAHSRYNALRRRLASFLRAADATTS